MANAGLSYEFFVLKMMKPNARKKVPYAQLLRLIDRIDKTALRPFAR
jgi:hypothetical protein